MKKCTESQESLDLHMHDIAFLSYDPIGQSSCHGRTSWQAGQHKILGGEREEGGA